MSAEPTTGTKIPCTCDHPSGLHHFSMYKDCRGQAGRGRCAVEDCPCRSFKVAHAEDAA